MLANTYIHLAQRLDSGAGRSFRFRDNELPATNRIANNKRMAPCLANVLSALVGHSTRRSLVYLVDDGS
ncbi:MAG: hypothetical protein JST44_25575 [Cyanobacteria bacterium SZAS LIN-5]|nr:hypothetical protein [Cyanobacteria bacterium SZAS LIN-5]